MKSYTFLSSFKQILVSGLEKATAIVLAAGRAVCRWYGGLTDVGRGRVQGMIGAAVIVGALSLLWPKTPPKPRAETMKAIEDAQARIAEIARQSREAVQAPPRSVPPVPAPSTPKTSPPPAVTTLPEALPPAADRYTNEAVSWDSPVASTVRFLLKQPASPNDWHVDSFHVQGNTAVAGVSVLCCGPAGWFYEKKLKIPDDDDSYVTRPGRLPVRVVGKRILVGDPAARRGSGVVHVFERTSDGWAPTARLAASDAHPEGNFGCSIDGEGDFVLVGAHSQTATPAGPSGNRGGGVVYLFQLNEKGWNEIARWTGGPNSQHFGSMVRMAGSRVAASGWVDSGPAILIGQVENQSIRMAGKLDRKAHGLAANPRFAFDGSTLVCKGEASIAKPGATRGAERVLAFETVDGSWRQVAELTAPDYNELDNPVRGFGATCEVSGRLMMIGRVDSGRLIPYTFQKDDRGHWHPVNVAKGGDRPSGKAGRLLLATLAGPDRFASLHMDGENFDFHECRREGEIKGPCPDIALNRIHSSFVEQDGKIIRQVGQKDPFTGEVYNFSLETGVKIFQGTYKDGKANGRHLTYFPNGRRHYDAQYADGLRDGEFWTFDEDGKIVTGHLYLKDKIDRNLMPNPEPADRQPAVDPLAELRGGRPQIQIEMPVDPGNNGDFDPANDDRMRQFKEQQNARRAALGLPLR